MASIKFGAFITGMKGKIGGTVFQGGASGDIAKAKALESSGKLTKADAGRLMQPRKTFAVCSGLWRLLTDAQRAAWNAQAVNWPALNRFGDTYTPSGFSVFMKLNNQLLSFTGVSLNDPPIAVSFPALEATTFNIPNDTDMRIDYANGVPPEFWLRVEATQPMGPSAQAKNSFFKVIAQIPSGVLFPQNIADGYKEIYGFWPNVCTIWFRICLLSTTTGQKGIYQYYKINVSF